MTSQQPPASDPTGVSERIGGLPAFEQLVEAFYSRVEQDPLLRPMYPDDLTPGKRHLALFFTQYWGGGPVYAQRRGHPRLRRRHAPFPITPEAAARWAALMTEAVREQGFDAHSEELLLDYVARATPTLINHLDVEVLPPGSSLLPQPRDVAGARDAGPADAAGARGAAGPRDQEGGRGGGRGGQEALG